MLAQPTTERAEVGGQPDVRRQLLQVVRLQVVDRVLGPEMLEAVAQEGEAAAGELVAKPAAELQVVVRLTAVFCLFV